MAIAPAKTMAMIIAIMILGAEEGFLPRARIEEKPTAAITADGPRIESVITSIMMYLSILLRGSSL